MISKALFLEKLLAFCVQNNIVICSARPSDFYGADMDGTIEFLTRLSSLPLITEWLAKQSETAIVSMVSNVDRQHFVLSGFADSKIMRLTFIHDLSQGCVRFLEIGPVLVRADGFVLNPVDQAIYLLMDTVFHDPDDKGVAFIRDTQKNFDTALSIAVIDLFGAKAGLQLLDDSKAGSFPVAHLKNYRLKFFLQALKRRAFATIGDILFHNGRHLLSIMRKSSYE